jgi:hypothetical protein
VKLDLKDASMGNQEELGDSEEDKIVLINNNLVNLLESGTGCLPVPGLYYYFKISYNQNTCCCFAWTHYQWTGGRSNVLGVFGRCTKAAVFGRCTKAAVITELAATPAGHWP